MNDDNPVQTSDTTQLGRCKMYTYMRSKDQPIAPPKARTTNVPNQQMQTTEPAMKDNTIASLQPVDNKPRERTVPSLAAKTTIEPKGSSETVAEHKAFLQPMANEPRERTVLSPPVKSTIEPKGSSETVEEQDENPNNGM